MAIIGTLPNNIQDGQLVDASPLMADFNYIVNQVNANANPVGTLTAPAGTTTIFYQAAAPLGWSISAGFTDHTIQVNAAAGGTTGGSSAYSTMFQAAWTSDGTAISIAQMPSHTHGVNDPQHAHGYNDPGHFHTTGIPTWSSGGSNAGFVGPGSGGSGADQFFASSAAGTGIGIDAAFTGISNQTTGGGATHTHTKTFNAQYVAMIMAAKS